MPSESQRVNIRKALALLERARHEGRSGVAEEKLLLRECRKGWRAGGWRRKWTALWALGKTRVEGGEKLVFLGLRERAKELVVRALYALSRYVEDGKVDLNDALVDHLKALMGSSDGSVRFWVLVVLGTRRWRGAKEWLRKIATEDPEGLGLRANMFLLQYGDLRAKDALLHELRRNPGLVATAEDLWEYRHRLRLDSVEERQVRQALGGYAAWLRRRVLDEELHEITRAWALARLALMTADGFAVGNRQIAEAGRLALTADEETRDEIVAALKRIGTPLALRQLKRLPR